jgi:hypothetical protein
VFFAVLVHQTADRTASRVINAGNTTGADGDEFLRLSRGRHKSSRYKRADGQLCVFHFGYSPIFYLVFFWLVIRRNLPRGGHSFKNKIRALGSPQRFTPRPVLLAPALACDSLETFRRRQRLSTAACPDGVETPVFQHI